MGSGKRVPLGDKDAKVAGEGVVVGGLRWMSLGSRFDF